MSDNAKMDTTDQFKHALEKSAEVYTLLDQKFSMIHANSI